MAELMAECYPLLTPKDDEYETMYTSLKNDIGKGRNWYLLQEKVLDGVLALIPMGGEFAVRKSEYVGGTLLGTIWLTLTRIEKMPFFSIRDLLNSIARTTDSQCVDEGDLIC